LYQSFLQPKQLADRFQIMALSASCPLSSFVPFGIINTDAEHHTIP
jgi:hypothetical protein